MKNYRNLLDYKTILERLKKLYDKYGDELNDIIAYYNCGEKYKPIQYELDRFQTFFKLPTSLIRVEYSLERLFSDVDDVQIDPIGPGVIQKIVFKFLDDAEKDYNHNIENAHEEPEENSNVLGKYAFPKDRLPTFSTPKEIDTRIESDLMNDIALHFDGSQPLSKDSANLIQTFLRDDSYKGIFKEPNVSSVYRGMAVNKQWIIDTLKLDDVKLKNKGKIDMNFSFIPHKNNGGSSWSTSKDFSWTWAIQSCYKNEIAILLHANILDNKGMFAIGENGLYKLKKPSKYKDQSEAVGLGTIKVSGIEWEIIE
jgi:hypothetical protein